MSHTHVPATQTTMNGAAAIDQLRVHQAQYSPIAFHAFIPTPVTMQNGQPYALSVPSSVGVRFTSLDQQQPVTAFAPSMDQFESSSACYMNDHTYACPVTPAASSSSHTTHADETDEDGAATSSFDVTLAPQSPPYFTHFNTSLTSLGRTLAEQYEQFFKRWKAFQKQNNLLIEGHDEKQIGSVTLNAFEAFRAVVTRGGFYRLFGLVPVLLEPPLVDARGIPRYFISQKEIPYEHGSIGVPVMDRKTAQEWSKKIGFLADGHVLLRNQQRHKAMRVYYERYCLAFEEEFCWAKGAQRPFLDTQRKQQGLCKYNFDSVKMEQRELPKEYRPSTEDLGRTYNYFLNLLPASNAAMGAEDVKLEPGAPTAAASASNAISTLTLPSAHPRTTSLGRSGTWAMMRTFEAAFLSNPFSFAPALLRELMAAVNHLVVASKHYALQCCNPSDRQTVDAMIRSMMHRGGPGGEAIPTEQLATGSVVSHIPHAQPSWFVDVLLWFEYDIPSLLLDLLVHPRSLARRLDALLAIEDDRRLAELQSPNVPGMKKETQLPFSLLPSKSYRFVVQSMIHQLDNLSVPQMNVQILTVVQNLSYPQSILQQHIESSTRPRGLRDQNSNNAPSTASMFVTTVRLNLLNHPLLVSTLIDFIDSTRSDALALPVDTTDEADGEDGVPLPIMASPVCSASTIPNGPSKMEIDDGLAEPVEEKKSVEPTPVASGSPHKAALIPSTEMLSLRPYIPSSCRYLSLQILSNLVQDLPWSDDAKIDHFSSSLLVQPSTHGERLRRRGVFWVEVTTELDCYLAYVTQQLLTGQLLASPAFSSHPGSAPVSLPPPLMYQLEFVMSTMQLLVSMVQNQKYRCVLEKMLSVTTSGKAGSFVQSGVDFYTSLLSIALVDLNIPGGETNHWSSRIQLAALEVVMQMIMQSSICASFFLRVPNAIARIVGAMQKSHGTRTRRTIAAVLAAVLMHVRKWDKQRQSANPKSTDPPLLLSILRTHQATIFEVIAQDADCSALLAKWMALLPKLTDEHEANRKQLSAVATIANGVPKS